VVHETNPLKSAQLTYYRMGDGPFHVFFTPFHLPHLQIASTIGRAALFGDATVTPLDGPRCEVLAVAKRDLRAGERLDAIGGFCTYGLIDNASTARGIDALPIGLAEGCTLVNDVAKDAALTMADVRLPAERLSDRLWREQQERWPTTSPARARAAVERDLVPR
jgi:predicted homoserine dehydrogenase-like protein